MERKRKLDFVVAQSSDTYEILYEDIQHDRLQSELDEAETVDQNESDQFQFVDEDEAGVGGEDDHAYFDLGPPLKVQKVEGGNAATMEGESSRQSSLTISLQATRGMNCQFCDKHFDSEKELESHLYFQPLLNDNPAYFICHHYRCGRKFASEVGLRSHFEEHIKSVTPDIANLPSNRNKKKTLNSCNFLFYMKRDEALFPKQIESLT